MANFRTGLIAGAAIATAAFLAPALAHAHDGKQANAALMTVVEANGRVDHQPNRTPLTPRGAGAVVAQSPFAMMDQMAAQMNRQMSMMMAQARSAPAAQNSGSQNIVAGEVPAGVCMQSMEVTQIPGHEPQVVRRQSGNCAAPSVAPSQAAPSQRAPAAAPTPRASVPRDSI
jgi:hypothetical protein